MTRRAPNLPKPAGLGEAHAALFQILTADQVAEFRSDPEGAPIRHHRGLGRYIRDEWLRHGRQCGAFVGLGPLSFDDMSSLILMSFAAALRGAPFDLGAEAERERDAGDSGSPRRSRLGGRLGSGCDRPVTALFALWAPVRKPGRAAPFETATALSV